MNNFTLHNKLNRTTIPHLCYAHRLSVTLPTTHPSSSTTGQLREQKNLLPAVPSPTSHSEERHRRPAPNLSLVCWVSLSQHSHQNWLHRPCIKRRQQLKVQILAANPLKSKKQKEENNKRNNTQCKYNKQKCVCKIVWNPTLIEYYSILHAEMKVSLHNDLAPLPTHSNSLNCWSGWLGCGCGGGGNRPGP